MFSKCGSHCNVHHGPKRGMSVDSELDIAFPNTLFEITRFEHRELFEENVCAWQALLRLEKYIETKLEQSASSPTANIMKGAVVGQNVILGKNVIIEPHAYVKGPAIIGDETEVRHGAYVRDNVVIGRGCIIGNATEVKHAILMDGTYASHWNYIGDSILGCNVNLGAGTKLSNKKLMDADISIRDLSGKPYPTGLSRLGAIVGDGTQIGCNAVLNPGTLLGKRCVVYPLVSARGTHAQDQVIKK